MITRYSRPEMTQIWSQESKYSIWYEIEAHACDAMADLGNAISKYDLHVHIHNAKDHHKEHNDPDHGAYEQSDLKSGAQKINTELVPHENKEDGHEHGHGHSHGRETETDPTVVFDFEEIF